MGADLDLDDVAHGNPRAVRELAELRAEVARLRGALTPSAETKAAYIGEFKFEVVVGDDSSECGPECDMVDCECAPETRELAVPWTTTKEIMAAILARADSAAPTDRAGEKGPGSCGGSGTKASPEEVRDYLAEIAEPTGPEPAEGFEAWHARECIGVLKGDRPCVPIYPWNEDGVAKGTRFAGKSCRKVYDQERGEWRGELDARATPNLNAVPSPEVYAAILSRKTPDPLAEAARASDNFAHAILRLLADLLEAVPPDTCDRRRP